MQAGTVVIIKDVIGVVQSNDGNTYQILCDDGVVRKVLGNPTEVIKPNALALLYYTKLLERTNNGKG